MCDDNEVLGDGVIAARKSPRSSESRAHLPIVTRFTASAQGLSLKFRDSIAMQLTDVDLIV